MLPLFDAIIRDIQSVFDTPMPIIIFSRCYASAAPTIHAITLLRYYADVAEILRYYVAAAYYLATFTTPMMALRLRQLRRYADADAAATPYAAAAKDSCYHY